MKREVGLSEAAVKAHDKAVKEGRDTYVDPDTGYIVFTQRAHERRGTCCGSACRHCPFDWKNVPGTSRLLSLLTIVVPITISMVVSMMSPYTASAQWIRSSIDTVRSFYPGTMQFVGQGPTFFPKNIFGAPDEKATASVPTTDPRALCSIGLDGTMVIGFRDVIVVDGPGPDFTVFENVFTYADGKRFVEPARVDVSRDGIQWSSFPFDSTSLRGCAGVTPTVGDADPFNPRLSGGDQFDLESIGVDSIRWIRLVDVSRIVLENRQHPLHDPSVTGFDLDAIVTWHGVDAPILGRIDHVPFADNVVVRTTSASANISVYSCDGSLVTSMSVRPGTHFVSVDSIPRGASLIVVVDDSVRTMKVLR